MGKSSKTKQASCLNSKVFKGMMSRKTTDSIQTGSLGVSRVRIFNANSEQYEAPTGRHAVQLPSNAGPSEVSSNTATI